MPCHKKRETYPIIILLFKLPPPSKNKLIKRDLSTLTIAGNNLKACDAAIFKLSQQADSGRKHKNFFNKSTREKITKAKKDCNKASPPTREERNRSGDAA